MFNTPLIILLATGLVSSVPLVGLPVPGDGTDALDPVLEPLLEGTPPGGILGVIVETTGPPAGPAGEARALGLEVGWTYTLIDGFSAQGTPEAIRALADHDDVLRITPDRAVAPLLDVSAATIGAPQAWEAGHDGSGVTIAVLDTGLDVLDPAFADAVVACVSTVAFVVTPECTDTFGHGTHVAGIAASRDAEYRGIAHGANLAIVRVLHAAGAGSISDIIAGLEWVSENKDVVSPQIRVVNLSLGSAQPGCSNGEAPEAKAASALVAEGVVVVAAAGNAGHDTCTIDSIAASPDVITVGALDDRETSARGDDTLAGFSSAGTLPDGTTKPDLVAPGVSIWAPYLGPTVAGLDGTSMAAPHVAGAVALLLDKEPALTPAEVKERLTGTTYAPPAAGELPSVAWGHGALDACAALGLSGCGTTSSQTTEDAPTQAAPGLEVPLVGPLRPRA